MDGNFSVCDIQFHWWYFKVVPGSECFYFSALNWRGLYKFLYSEVKKIQCKRVGLNCLKLWFLCLGARIPKIVCSESFSVTFRRTLGLTLRFQNKNPSMNRDKAARVFPVCHFLLHTTTSSLVFLVCICRCTKEDTELHLSIFSKRAEQESQTTCFLILQWKCCWGLSLLNKL